MTQREEALERQLVRVTEERDNWKQHAAHIHDELIALLKDKGLFVQMNETHVTKELWAALEREATLREQVEELERRLAEQG